MDNISKQYKFESVLGKGSFGEVVRATHFVTNEQRAIKIIKKSRISGRQSLM
jgi:serine/threonine protein kinase